MPYPIFIREDLPVYLHTDASDSGIWTYFSQSDQLKNKEYPVAFVSKLLSKAERNCYTIDKEAFAIFFALMKLEYLLHDIHFVLQTDHANILTLTLTIKVGSNV